MYLRWLQRDNPTGDVDRFPELTDRFDTSVAGLYCAGDLTGIPLVKLAADSGAELVERLAADDAYRRQRDANSAADTLDLLIVGAGPAGVAASMRAQTLHWRHVVIESSRVFNTIANFPAGKPILVTPEDRPFRSELTFADGTKETLLEQLREAVAGRDLPVVEGETVRRITKRGGVFEVETDRATRKALRVVVAIGKTGNARQLGAAGEQSPHVYTRLIDPGEFHGRDILVVGGGDSAVEAAVALAKAGNRVTLSYRRESLSRPKAQNVRALEEQVAAGGVATLFGSTVKEVRATDAVLETGEGERVVAADTVLVLIGTEIPVELFRRSGIRMQGERRAMDWVKLAATLSWALVLYFGKKAPDTSVNGLAGFVALPGTLLGMVWQEAVKGMAAWAGLIGLGVCGAVALGHALSNRSRYFSSSWNTLKHLYYTCAAALVAFLYVAYKLAGARPVFGDMGEWYTVLYSVTVILFGLRRMHVTPTGYVRRQTWTLIAVQVVPLCILPLFVLPVLGKAGLLDGWVMDTVFPGQSYWRAYGFILAWPLFIHNLATGAPTAFWLVVGCVQTFVVIPWLNYRWGKGAYCGWICSCGALAETLGNEYRSRALHGPAAKRSDNAGQVVLWLAAAVTLLALLSGSEGNPFSAQARHVYDVFVDILCSGVLGVGLYFLWGGRVWCRALCPLAALMHVYTRFSPYRIMSNKKRCISCGICTKVCHMGIDVMGYANKGIPMNDVECVRCSACITSCPMQVLTFGGVGKSDPDNREYLRTHLPLTPGWASGLPQKDIEMLLEKQRAAASGGS